MKGVERVAACLHRAARRYLQDAARELAFGDRVTALKPLSYGAACCYHAHRIGQSSASTAGAIENAVNEAILEVEFWSTCGREKGLIHSESPEAAERKIRRRRGMPENLRLFWLGYLHAEHWDNTGALEMFQALFERCASSPAVLHWIGNLLAKLGRFSAAAPFLDEARKREPHRYNHYSHLGNVYRGLKRNAEAEACYRKAISLMEKGPIDRVEHIHLVRCFQGLSALGHSEYAGLEQSQQMQAVQSGRATNEELERIKF